MADIEQILSDQQALPSLQRLVDSRCDREHILTVLKLIQEPLFGDSWEDITGMPPKKLRGAIKRLCKCADEIQGINKGWHRWVVLEAAPDVGRSFIGLPQMLRSYALQLEVTIQSSGPKKHPMLNAAKCHLVRYVKATTGRYYDAEVSSLIGAVLDNDLYDALNHRMWRKKYCPPTSRSTK